MNFMSWTVSSFSSLSCTTKTRGIIICDPVNGLFHWSVSSEKSIAAGHAESLLQAMTDARAFLEGKQNQQELQKRNKTSRSKERKVENE